jgi:hypothetical protein
MSVWYVTSSVPYPSRCLQRRSRKFIASSIPFDTLPFACIMVGDYSPIQRVNRDSHDAQY